MRKLLIFAILFSLCHVPSMINADDEPYFSQAYKDRRKLRILRGALPYVRKLAQEQETWKKCEATMKKVADAAEKMKQCNKDFAVYTGPAEPLFKNPDGASKCTERVRNNFRLIRQATRQVAEDLESLATKKTFSSYSDDGNIYVFLVTERLSGEVNALGEHLKVHVLGWDEDRAYEWSDRAIGEGCFGYQRRQLTTSVGKVYDRESCAKFQGLAGAIHRRATDLLARIIRQADLSRNLLPDAKKAQAELENRMKEIKERRSHWTSQWLTGSYSKPRC